VTGSNGLIGSAIAKRFESEFTVAGLDLGQQKASSPVSAFFSIDLTSGQSVAQALAGIRERYGQAVASVILWPPTMTSPGSPAPCTSASPSRARGASCARCSR
jgi:nucleoside-diphosphate-sugar epimerase